VFEPRTVETTLPVHVVDPIETVGLQPTSDATENKKVSLIFVPLHISWTNLLEKKIELKIFILINC
jgi:hypothetical protein